MENARELMLLVDAVAKEKGLPKSEILSFLAEGIEVALRKNFPEGAQLQVEIDEKTGEIQAWRIYELVDQIENIETQMLHNEVEDEEVSDGYAWEKFEPKLNRQQFNITKQVTLQKIKNESREQMIQTMLERDINIYSGIVKVIRKESIIVDYSGLDISIARRNLLPRETFKLGDRIRFTIDEEDGHQVGTRTSEKFLIELFKEEIPQVADGDIEIVACSRNPGLRSKVVVRSNVSKIDAARMCIGSKGVHIKNIQQEIRGEFIDVIQYNSDPAQLLVSAIAPVSVTNIVIDEDAKTMEIAVSNDDISQAIGRNGNNISMISKLLGWDIKVFSEDQWTTNQQAADIGFVHYFAFALDCDQELAEYIVNSGLTSVEEIAYLSEAELELDELDSETVSALKTNAKETIADKDKLAQAKAILDLFSLGFDEEEVNTLIENKVMTVQDVADLSTYDLQDYIPNIDMTKAEAIIRKSRQL